MAAELILVDIATVRPVRVAEALDERHPADDHERASHFAAKKGKQVLGVVSIVPDMRGKSGERWRMVGLAVDPESRGAGLGAMLVRAACAIAANRGGGLWCTAEGDAAEYLEKRAFVREGDALVATLEAPPPSEDDD